MNNGTETYAVSIKNMSAGYSENFNILTGVNLDIRHRDFFAVIGPNGGGKTTLVRVVLGLLEPSAGFSLVYGKSVKTNRSLIGYVPQYSTCRRDFPITVERMVGLGLQNSIAELELSRLEQRKRILDSLQLVGLEGNAQSHLRELSGGQLQRALIAQALVRNPKLLILDEPTANIDPGGEASLLKLFEELVKDMTLVLVSHDVHYVLQAVTRVACVNRTVEVHDAVDFCHLDHHQIYGKSMKPVSHNH